MIRGESLTAIIPARKGSKGIPGKNLYTIDGETLVERAIRLAQRSKRVDRTLVTTDDPEIFGIARKLDAAPPSLRPAELASDTALTIDAVRHVLNDAQVARGYVLLLQVTTPLRIDNDLEKFLEMFESDLDAEAAVSVVEHNSPHPEKVMKMDGKYITTYMGNNPSVPRQILPRVFALNGAFYLTSLEIIQARGTFLPQRTIRYKMPLERSINLDGPMDLLLLEAILAEKKHDSEATGK